MANSKSWTKEKAHKYYMAHKEEIRLARRKTRLERRKAAEAALVAKPGPKSKSVKTAPAKPGKMATKAPKK